MMPINPPARFLLNQFLRAEISLATMLIYMKIRVKPSMFSDTIQVFTPLGIRSLLVNSSIGDVIPRFYNRTVEHGYPNDPEGAEIIRRYANLYWDRMEER